MCEILFGSHREKKFKVESMSPIERLSISIEIDDFEQY
jgi:hypothetical protein